VVPVGARAPKPRTSDRGILNRDVLEAVFAHDELAELDAGERRLALRSLIAQERLDCTIAELADWVDGWGPLSGLMRDSSVTDVLVNGPYEVWVERAGRLSFEGALFKDARELLNLVDRMLGDAGVQADAAHPFADARLADGARLHVVIPPIAPGGPLISIRRFAPHPMTLTDLKLRGMFGEEDAAALTSAVQQRRTLVISGGTGTGKTTLLNALLGCVGDDERVVVIEETAELRPLCKHAVSLLGRPANAEGRGEVDLASLVRVALRMRPDRIVVGEMRGPEALAALMAMSTGHAGSMVTIHAGSGGEAIRRIVSLALGARTGATEETLGAAVERAVDVSVHLERLGGVRRVSAIRHLR
jgi:pilus assembly protein CpaF